MSSSEEAPCAVPIAVPGDTISEKGPPWLLTLQPQHQALVVLLDDFAADLGLALAEGAPEVGQDRPEREAEPGQLHVDLAQLGVEGSRLLQEGPADDFILPVDQGDLIEQALGHDGGGISVVGKARRNPDGSDHHDVAEGLSDDGDGDQDEEHGDDGGHEVGQGRLKNSPPDPEQAAGGRPGAAVPRFAQGRPPGIYRQTPPRARNVHPGDRRRWQVARFCSCRPAAIGRFSL